MNYRRRVTLRTLVVGLSACGLAASLATAVSLPGSVTTAAGRHVDVGLIRYQSGTAPNLPAPRPPTTPTTPGAPATPGVTTTPTNGYSFNWSGYVATSSTNQYFTEVTAGWTVPTLTCTAEDRIDSLWVGLDGWTNSTVEQDGTSAQCFEGKAVYYSWYEMYPAGTVEVGTTVHPGDKISASVTRTGTSYKMSLLDSTTAGNNISVTKTCALATCSDTSAEWIVERPEYSSTGIVPLAQFSPITFSGSRATGGTITSGAISQFSATHIEMVDSTDTYNLETTGALNAAGIGWGDSWLNSY